MIKAVIFDYFGVVCSDEYWQFVKADKNMEGEFHDLARDVNIGELSWHEFIEEVATKLGKPVDEIKALYESEHIHPEMVAYVAQIHKKYRTALLSNANHEFLQPIITKAKLDEIFDKIIMSSVVGATKPDPAIFHYALDKLEIKPNEAVFVDDIASNAAAAAALGIHAIVYKDFAQMRRDLKDILDAQV